MSSIKQQLAAIEARAEKATPGPWRAGLNILAEASICRTGPNEGYVVNAGPSLWSDKQKNDFAFIAAARTDIPRLVAALKCAVEGLEEIKWCPSEAEYETKRVLAEIEKILKGEK